MNNELRAKVISALKKRLGKQSKADFASLDKKFDTVLEKMTERMSTQLLTKVSPNVIVDNLKEVMQEVLKADLNIKNFPESFEVKQTEKPEWYVEPHKEVSIDDMPAVEIKGVVKTKADMTESSALLAIFFEQIVSFFSKLAQGTFSVMLPKHHYTTPQMMVLVDPRTMKPISPQEIGLGTMNAIYNTGIAAAPSSVSIRGANTVGDGTLSVTTAGTRVQLPDVSVSRVRIQAHIDNTGDVIIGGSTVIASAGTRRGVALSNTQWTEFDVNNLNKLWIDSTANGDKINYVYEYAN